MQRIIKQFVSPTLLVCWWLSGCLDETLLDDLSQLPEPGDFVVTFIDVGQGDAALLELPSGEVILIDSGPQGSGTRIVDLLEERDIDELDIVILSHPHGDHYGGLRFVLDMVPVNEIWENGENVYDYGYVQLKQAVSALEIPVVIPRQDETRVLGEVTIRVLNREEGYEGRNNDSLVLMVSFGEVDILFSGDIEHEETLDLVRDYGAVGLASEILKVPHHGSSDTGLEFIDASAPEVAIISCGRDNLYGHPHPEILDAYEKMGTMVYRTDQAGDVVARVNYQTLELTLETNGGY